MAKSEKVRARKDGREFETTMDELYKGGPEVLNKTTILVNGTWCRPWRFGSDGDDMYFEE